MKIAVFSDVHNSDAAMDAVVQAAAAERADKIVFCGDLFGGFGDCQTVARKAQSLDGVLYFVRGNNDYYGERFIDGGLEENVVMYHFGRILFFTHGDRYDKYRLPAFLRENDVLIYGHTHRALLQRHDGIFIANVGSVARPRDGVASYLTISENGIVLKRLDGTTVLSLPFVPA